MSDNQIGRVGTELVTRTRQEMLAEEGFEKHNKKTPSDQFLEEKVRQRGLHKNNNLLFVACGLVNLYMVRRRLVPVM